MKPNVDYAFKVSKSKNGALSLKVWISSIFSTDLRELLLHLVRIKFLYSQLINRFYVVNPYFNYIKNNYMIKSPNQKVIIHKKRRKRFKIFIKNFNSLKKFHYKSTIKSLKKSSNLNNKSSNSIKRFRFK
jgi:hypothetical protein